MPTHQNTSQKATQTTNAVAAEQSNKTGISLPAVPVLQQKSVNADLITDISAEAENISSASENNGPYKPAPQNKPQTNQPVQQFKAAAPNKTGMPDQLKAGIEGLSGFAMDDVRVNYNSSKPAQFKAHAYAQGTEIHIGAGQEKHLPHEAWHVVQQKQGRVQPTMQMKGKVNVNDDAGLESEADMMGAKALQFGSNHSENIAQRKQNDTGNITHQYTVALQAKTENLPGIMQMAPWANIGAKFKTDNGMPNIPNSEYLVEATTYKRYAPINEIRAPGQIYHEGPRNFAYVDASDGGKPAVNNTDTALPDALDDQRVKLTGNNGASEVRAYKTPVNGLLVWDGTVADNGTVSSRHPGHAVMELGQALPHLESEDSRKLASFQQQSIKDAQAKGLIPDDTTMSDGIYKWIDANFKHIKNQNARDNAGLSYLATHPDAIPALKKAKEDGKKAKEEDDFNVATSKIVEWLDSISPRE